MSRALLLLSVSVLALCKYTNMTGDFAAEIYYENDADIIVNMEFQNLPSYKAGMYMAIGFGSTVDRLADWWVCKNKVTTTSTEDRMGNGTIFGDAFDPPIDAVNTVDN